MSRPASNRSAASAASFLGFASEGVVMWAPLSNRSSRCATIPNCSPYASTSGWNYPTLSPRLRPPPETISSVLAIFAVTAGCRKCMPCTIVPTRILDVAWVSAVSVTYALRQGPWVSPTMG